jgi:hypothetical protein
MVTMPNDRPAAVQGLDVNEVKDGLIVYDHVTDRVHYLNATAAIVFTMCDGQHDVSAIASFVAEAFELDDAPVADIDKCISSLVNEGLLQ